MKQIDWKWYAIALLALTQLVTIGAISHDFVASRDRFHYIECFVDLDPPDGEPPCNCDPERDPECF